jgi:hypothetical protein
VHLTRDVAGSGGRPQQCHQAALAAKLVLARASQGGEGQEAGEVVFGEAEQVLRQHLLGRGQHPALQQLTGSASRASGTARMTIIAARVSWSSWHASRS